MIIKRIIYSIIAIITISIVNIVIAASVGA